ncbi:MAG: hypothetical protein GW946_01600 [Candidatus Pacebacteria bacterium]|nr:hypothetical protein [Candidatus Paceibacterota bacterium]PIR60594.1 MAG: hypothetical protein COU67_01410 [Candidatus Pacebacteria bacterium CG10_big_fil_rev_8_21_14_0_10_44_54]
MQKSTSKSKIIKPVENVPMLASSLEHNFAAHGIKVRVMEINFHEKHLEFQLEIAMGEPISNFENLSRDIALFLASPTGKIELVAPIPGTHRIGINLPRRTEVDKPVMPVNKEAEVHYREKTGMYYLRNFFAEVLFLLIQALGWIAGKLYQSEQTITQFASTKSDDAEKNNEGGA